MQKADDEIHGLLLEHLRFFDGYIKSTKNKCALNRLHRRSNQILYFSVFSLILALIVILFTPPYFVEALIIDLFLLPFIILRPSVIKNNQNKKRLRKLIERRSQLFEKLKKRGLNREDMRDVSLEYRDIKNELHYREILSVAVGDYDISIPKEESEKNPHNYIINKYYNQ